DCGNEQDCLKKSIEQVNRYGYNMKLAPQSAQQQPVASPSQKPSGTAVDSKPSAKPSPTPAPSLPSASKRRRAVASVSDAAKPQPQGGEPRVTMSIGEDAGAFVLRLDYTNNERNPIQVSTTSDIAKLLDPVVRRFLVDDVSNNEEAFDEIIVAD